MIIECEDLQDLLTRWLRGANAGSLRNLQVLPWNKGTGLFLNADVTSRKPRQGLLVASLVGGVLRVYHQQDFFALQKLAGKLKVPVMQNDPNDYRDNGWLDSRKV